MMCSYIMRLFRLGKILKGSLGYAQVIIDSYLTSVVQGSIQLCSASMHDC